MTKLPKRIVAALAVLALILTACTSIEPATDNLVGTWYQNGGPVDLIWEFHADHSVTVHAWSSPVGQKGIYRHLQDNRVALDFGGDAVSVVEIVVNENKMTMTNPGGTQTTLERKK